MPTESKKGHTGKSKTKYVVSSRENTTSATNICLMHGPGHSSQNCKLLKEYFKKYAKQRPHTKKEAHSSGKTKRDKSVELDRNTKEFNIVEHDDPIHKKKK